MTTTDMECLDNMESARRALMWARGSCDSRRLAFWSSEFRRWRDVCIGRCILPTPTRDPRIDPRPGDNVHTPHGRLLIVEDVDAVGVKYFADDDDWSVTRTKDIPGWHRMMGVFSDACEGTIDEIDAVSVETATSMYSAAMTAAVDAYNAATAKAWAEYKAALRHRDGEG